MSTSLRSVAVGMALVMAVTACGDDASAPDDLADPFETVERALPDEDAPQRAAPRWEEILTLSDDGPATEEFPIPEDVLQWRVRYRCESGQLQLDTGADDPLLDAQCPDEGDAFSIETGIVELDIQASAPWEATIEQQVDTVHDEPPLEGMDEAEVVAAGDFYGIERRGEGTATVYRMPDGGLALRFTDFQTVASPDLFVWVSESEEPVTSEDAFEAPHVDLGEITATLGNQNYVLPDDVDADQIRSIIIWCAPLQIAYTAAVLQR